MPRHGVPLRRVPTANTRVNVWSFFLVAARKLTTADALCAPRASFDGVTLRL